MQALSNAEVYTDFSAFSDLRRISRDDPDAALREVAKQFESIFINMVLKSAREANFGDPIFEDTDNSLYNDMFDNQLALSMSSGKGIGLAEKLVEQLRGIANLDKKAITEAGTGKDAIFVAPLAVSRSSKAEQQVEPVKFESAEAFVRELYPAAQAASERLGVSPQVLLAQAALETGWGKSILNHANGRSSYNLFNIKAGNGWNGERVATTTLEFRDGTMRPEQASFRSYGSFEESFNDYVDFIWSRQRYQDALVVADEPGAYLNELERAGYATDPDYAEKIMDILKREGLTAQVQEYELG